VEVPVVCSSPAPDEGQVVCRQNTWQRLFALSLPLGDKVERVEPRKEKENWPLGNESRSPGSGRRGAQLRGARGRQGGGGGRSAGSGLEKTDLRLRRLVGVESGEPGTGRESLGFRSSG
jgi:hypothetical protein